MAKGNPNHGRDGKFSSGGGSSQSKKLADLEAEYKKLNRISQKTRDYRDYEKAKSVKDRIDKIRFEGDAKMR